MTKQDRLCAALRRRGATPLPPLTDCLVFSDPEAGKFPHIPKDNKYYVGTKGSIRRGRTRAASMPISDRIKAEWLAEII